jgi:hypothetical protein
VPLGGGRLLLLNDNNYPLSAGRNPDRPDGTEAIIVRPEALRDNPTAPFSDTRPPSTGGFSPKTTAGLALLLAAAIPLLAAWARSRGEKRRTLKTTTGC